MMKKFLSAVLVIMLVLSSAQITFAHNGKRDNLGGHFKSANGTYHFHSYSASFAKAKSKQDVVNLIKSNNSSASKYNVSVNSVDWSSFSALYGFTPGGSGSSSANQSTSSSTSKGTTTNQNTSSNATANATVVSVTDGDTIKAKLTSGSQKGKTVTIRMSDIDTPETVHPNKPIQPYGKEASNRTKKLLPKNTKIKLVYEKQKVDSYGRHVAFVFKGNTNVNVQLVQEGLARVDYTYAKKGEKYYNSLTKAESAAKKSKKKIWSINGYVQSKFMRAS